jgi:hypothetical protein
MDFNTWLQSRLTAHGWAIFGINAQGPLVGSIGVIRWSAKLTSRGD